MATGRGIFGYSHFCRLMLLAEFYHDDDRDVQHEAWEGSVEVSTAGILVKRQPRAGGPTMRETGRRNEELNAPTGPHGLVTIECAAQVRLGG